jgi:GTPase
LSKFKSGFISIVGCPNAGKSTLLNSIIGRKIAIVSRRPQTTRNKVLGIRHMENGQIIFMDTPGIHRHKGALNQFMIKTALATLNDVDIVFFLVDVNVPIGKDGIYIINNLKKIKRPVILCINKTDKTTKQRVGQLASEYSGLLQFKEIIPISALKNEGIDKLLQLSMGLLPAGPRYFPDDTITDVPERFIVAEIIREKVFDSTWQEVPYSVAVEVDQFKEESSRGIISVFASIYCERDSQKGMIIGKNGKKLKEIGTMARKEIEKFLGVKVYLDLLVKVKKEWSKDLKRLKEFGYG